MRRMTRFVRRLATTISALKSTPSVKSAFLMTTLCTSLASLFSIEAATASSSMSIPSTSLAPSLLANIDNMPVPQPTSSTLSPSLKYDSSKSADSEVVS